MDVTRKRRAVIVSGSRDADVLDWAPRVRNMIEAMGPELIIQGECDYGGIDEIAVTLAGDYDIPTEDFPADWEEAERVYGNRKRAGPVRNLKMLARLNELAEEGWSVAVVCFHDDIESSKGTKNMRDIARKAGVRTMVVTLDGSEWVK